MFTSPRITASSSSSLTPVTPAPAAPTPAAEGLVRSFSALSIEPGAQAADTSLASKHPRLQIEIPTQSASWSEIEAGRSSSESPSTPPRAATGPREAPWAPARKRRREEEQEAQPTPPQSPTGSEADPMAFDAEDDGPPSPPLIVHEADILQLQDGEPIADGSAPHRLFD